MNDADFIDQLWADWSPGFDGTEAATAVKQSLAAPENLAAALGYYRATLGGVGLDARYDEIQNAGMAPVTIPALYLHGANDGCIGPDVADATAGMLTHERSRVEVVEDAGHFLQLEAPARVNQLVVDFLAE